MIQTGEIDPSVLSHAIRQRVELGAEQVIFFEADLPAYVGEALPKPREQVNNLLLWIGRRQSTSGRWVSTTMTRLAAIIGASMGVPGTNDERDVNWLLGQLKLEKLFDMQSNAACSGEVEFRLTMPGWTAYEELRHRVVASRTAFMAMKFNDPTLDRVLKDVFKPAAQRAGFVLRPVNENQPAGLIDDQIRAAIRTARFVVVDLTHDSNGAYFEAGFAEGLGLPVIYTCEAAKFSARQTHFDTNHMNTLPWSVNALDDAGRQLTAMIRNTLPLEAKMND